MMEWASKFEDMAYKRVGFTKVGDAEVSTVWLGLDHQFGNGNPQIFETMVFGGNLDGEQRRYSTEEEALNGHEGMVAEVRNASSRTPDKPPADSALPEAPQ